MGFIKETFLLCDGEFNGCRVSFGRDDREFGMTAKELRRLARKEEGWIYKDGHDYCVGCKKQIIPSRRLVAGEGR